MHQYLFFIGDFPIRAYGLLLMLGIIGGGLVSYALARLDGRGYDKHIFDVTLYGGIAGLVGGRLWDVFFFDWAYYGNHLLEIPFVWQGGMAIQGGIVGGVIAFYFYTRKHQLDFWEFADIMAPGMILGQAIGRMANLMNGDAFGAPTGGNFGILYPETTLAFRTYGAQPLWPAEIWEGQIDVLIFVALLVFLVSPHKKGQVITLYAMLYSLARFFLEFLRGDYVNLTLGLKSAQMTSLVVILACLALFTYLHFRKDDTRTTEPPASNNTITKNKKRK